MPGSAIKAINLGYSVVMAPAKYYMHTNPTSLSLPKFYAFEPVPDSVDEKYILGGEGCLWGGINERDDEYKTWPRAMALSEALWSQKNGRSYDNFARRVVHRFKYFDLNQIKYSIAGFEPVIERVEWDQDAPQGVEPEKESSRIKITTALPEVDVYYRFDDTEPDEFSPKYEDKSLAIPLGASRIIVVTYYEGKPVGRQEKRL